MLVIAPDGIIQVISHPQYPQTLISVIPVPLVAVLALCKCKSPVLHIDMFMSCVLRNLQSIGSNWDSCTIEVLTRGLSDKGEDCRRDVSVRSYDIGNFACRDTRTANDERDIDVFFEATFFAWLESVLTYVVAIVGGIHDVRVVEEVSL
jgi:hypothetical protein